MRIKSMLLASTAMLGVGPATAWADPASNALPTGGQVTSGAATLQQSNGRLDVNQTSQRAIINWQSYNIGNRASVNYNQPSASAVALNRVLSGIPSEILGNLTANGQVFLVNPSGITFGKTASVNVQGLVASTLNITDQDFNGGNSRFTRGTGSAGKIDNQGTIAAKPGGYVGFIAPEIRNEGVILAQLGTIFMGAGDAVTVTFEDGGVTFEVDPGTIATLITNNQMIMAPDGHIVMSAKAADGLVGGVINNAGTIEANSLTANGGTVQLLASGDIVHSGLISANAGTAGKGGTVALVAGGTDKVTGAIAARGGEMSGDGGTVETSGHAVKISGASIDTRAPNGKTGNWTLDPYDLTVTSSAGTITPSSGAYSSGPGGSAVNNTDIDNALATTNVTLATGGSAGDGQGNGDINVKAPISWNSPNSLTFNAFHDINIAASITHGGTLPAQFSLNPNQGNAGGKLIVGNGNTAEVTLLPTDALLIGGTQFTLINDAAAFAALPAGQSGHWALNADLDFSNANFTPIGSTSTPFSGVLEGLGHNLSNVTINAPGNYVGLFAANSGSVSNLHLASESVNGGNYVGGLAGDNSGTIFDVMVSGTITGGSWVGGLVGQNEASGVIQRVPVYGTITATTTPSPYISYIPAVGGVAGVNYGAIDTTFVDANISGSGTVGGVAGANRGSASITNAFIYSTLTDRDSEVGSGVGGVTGFNEPNAIVTADISQSTVQGVGIEGGLVGDNRGTISNSYTYYGLLTVAPGATFGSAGGIAGSNSGLITNVWNSAPIQLPAGSAGGIADRNSGTIQYAGNAAAITVGTNSNGIGADLVGGIVGGNSGPITNSFSTGAITVGSAASNVGGAAGENSGSMSSVYATGSVIAGDKATNIGGLIGENTSGWVQLSYAANSVRVGVQASNIGGLAGVNWYGGGVDRSFANTNLSVGAGSSSVGGLVGYNAVQNFLPNNTETGLIGNSYAVGTITVASGGANSTGIGGLVGTIDPYAPYGTVGKTYAAVAINAPGATNVGGLIGQVTSSGGNVVYSSFWDVRVSGQTTSAGGPGATGQQSGDMTQPSTYQNAGWDFNTVWTIQPGATYPYFRDQTFASAPVPTPP